jgi:hypothetical protein
MTSFGLLARVHARMGAARLQTFTVLFGLTVLAVSASPLTSVDSNAAESSAPRPTQTMFGSTQPGTTSDPDETPVELGTKFRVKVDGMITGIRYYKSAANTGPHTGTLWTAKGAKLAAVAFGNETGTGWQTARLAGPTAVKADTTYVVSYHTDTGHYAADSGYFDGRGAGTGDVTALAQGVDGPNGVYAYGSGAFPSATWRAANYWVDVLFVPGSGATPNPPRPPTTRPPTTRPAPPPTTAPPSSGAAPGPDNTGVPAGTTLAPSSGFTVSTAGAVIDSLAISGTITVKAPNVVIRRCQFTGDDEEYAVQVVSGSVRIEDSEIAGGYHTAGVGYDNWTALRLDVHNVPDDGFKLGDNTLLADSWLHDFTPEQNAHADGVQMQSGVVNATIRHNTIDIAGNAALFLAPDLGPSTDGPLLVENNILGGGNYTLFNVDGNNGQYTVANITIRNNKFLHDARFGSVLQNVPSAWTDNVYADSSEAIAG